MAKLNAVLFNCTLKPKGEKSSTQAMLDKVVAALHKHDVACHIVHASDAGIKFGTDTDMGEGDGWPPLHRQILDSEIIVIGAPIWFGQRSSVSQMVLERIDAMLYETNDKGQYPLYNKVAGVCVVGNEDGAQHVGSTILYNLMQTGATIPPNAEAYWVGAAGGKDDFVDVALGDETVALAVKRMASNLVALARSLQKNPIPLDENTAE